MPYNIILVGTDRPTVAPALMYAYKLQFRTVLALIILHFGLEPRLTGALDRL